MAISAAQMATSECAELQLGRQLQLLNLSHEDHFSKHYFTRSPDSRRFYCLVHPDYKRNADRIREVAKHCVCFRAFGRMAYRQYLRRLKSSPTEERARVILDEIGSYCRKPAAIFASEQQIDVRARDLLPEDAPPALMPVVVGADGNCLYRAFSLLFQGNESGHVELRLRTAVELLLHKSYYRTICGGRADTVALESGFSRSSCLTIFFSKDGSGKQTLQYRVTLITLV